MKKFDQVDIETIEAGTEARQVPEGRVGWFERTPGRRGGTAPRSMQDDGQASITQGGLIPRIAAPTRLCVPHPILDILPAPPFCEPVLLAALDHGRCWRRWGWSRWMMALTMTPLSWPVSVVWRMSSSVGSADVRRSDQAAEVQRQVEERKAGRSGSVCVHALPSMSMTEPKMRMRRSGLLMRAISTESVDVCVVACVVV